MQRVILALALAAMTSCATTSGELDPTQLAPAPRLDRMPVLDRPTGGDDDPAARAWRIWEAAGADLLPSQEGLPFEVWARRDFKPWLVRRTTAVRDLQPHLAALARGTPAERLFAAVVDAALMEDLGRSLIAVRPPRGLRAEVAEITSPILRRARDAYARCVTLAADAPEPLPAWATRCQARAEGLGQVTKATPHSREPPLARPSLPAQCTGPTAYVDPEAPAPNLAEPPMVAVIAEGLPLSPEEKTQLITAVTGRLPVIPDALVLSAQEVEAAARLHAERRWSAQGPVCGQPPPLAALLARAHPNLILARVRITCGWKAGESADAKRCRLDVVFDRAGTDDRDGLPALLVADETDGSAASLIASVPTLREGGMSGLLAHRPDPFLTTGHQRYDPWLRVAPTLHETRGALQDCLPKSSAVALDLAWTISPVGVSADVEVTPVENLPGEDGAKVQACVTRVIEGVAWPCTPSGQPEPVQVRLCMGR